MDTALRNMTAAEVPENAMQWRNGMLDGLLRVSSWLGGVAGLISVLIALRAGFLGIAVVDTLMEALAIGLCLGKNIPYRIRAAAFSAIPFVLGVMLLQAFGIYAQLFFITCAVLTALLLGVRAGLLAAALCAVCMAGAGLLGLTGPEQMMMVTGADAPLWWLAIAVNFLLVTSVLTIAVGMVLARLEQALAEAIAAREVTAQQRELLRTFVDTVPDVVYSKDAQGRFRIVNAATLAMLSVRHADDVIGKTVFDLYPQELAERLHADDMSALVGSTVLNREVTTRDPDGRLQWYLTMKVPFRDPSGEITGVIGISRNITDRKQLEEQLRQAQKMEAVGKLAGGVAHDFNNLLTIIVGFSELLHAELQAHPALQEPVAAITDAADRAASLTRQLLAFSRQTLLQPKVLDLNARITDTSRMVSRLIGEDIRVSLVLDPAIARVKVDPGQFDQVLMNLAVNARDAMHDGGELRIATDAVTLTPAGAEPLDTPPGAYVLVSVSDTGVGMDADVQSRIFEPFFTTKGVGTGTGLGLATVFGIVRQSGGRITVESESGRGATFRIYLPVVSGDTPNMPALAGATSSDTDVLTYQ